MSRTVVLIDDDKIIQDAWTIAAQNAEILFIGYLSIESFLSDSHLYQKGIEIFIDSELNGKKGELEARRIYELGFMSLTLIKGFQFTREENLPHYILKLISKSAPF